MTDTFAIEKEDRRLARCERANVRKAQNRKRSVEASERLAAAGSENICWSTLLYVLPLDRDNLWIILRAGGVDVCVGRARLQRIATEVRRNSRMRAGLRAALREGVLQIRWRTGGLDLPREQASTRETSVIVTFRSPISDRCWDDRKATSLGYI